MGNLAHALKTPLSVVVNEATARGEDPLALKVREQAGIMRDQVSRHLERARIAARATVVGSVTDVRPVVTGPARTMEKIYHPRGIAINAEAPDDVRLRGERQDLEEMLGNLVDNACKWAQARVNVEVTPERAEGAPPKANLRIRQQAAAGSKSFRLRRRLKAARSPGALGGKVTGVEPPGPRPPPMVGGRSEVTTVDLTRR